MIFDVPIYKIIICVVMELIFVTIVLIMAYYRNHTKKNPLLFIFVYSLFLIAYLSFSLFQSHLCRVGIGDLRQRELHLRAFMIIFLSEMISTVIVVFVVSGLRWPKKE